MSEQTFYQAQLPPPDGRFVRMRELTSADQERASAAANVMVGQGKDGVTTADLQRLNRESLKLALVGVSKPKPPKFAPEDLRPEDWIPLDAGKLETGFDEVFNAKARVLLQRLYDRVHVPAQEDVEAFLGGALSAVVIG